MLPMAIEHRQQPLLLKWSIGKAGRLCALAALNGAYQPTWKVQLASHKRGRVGELGKAASGRGRSGFGEAVRAVYAWKRARAYT